MILLSGVTDGGTTTHVAEMAEILQRRVHNHDWALLSVACYLLR